MAKKINTETYNLLLKLANSTQCPSRLGVTDAIRLASQGYLDTDGENVFITSKASRDLSRHENRLKQSRVNQAIAYFLGGHMQSGVGYSVKPQGKSSVTSILPHVAKFGIDRDGVLNTLKALRKAGYLETNAGHVKNNCSIRWYLAGTFEPDTGEAQNSEPKEEGMQVFCLNGNSNNE